jgi:hypothetical protein
MADEHWFDSLHKTVIGSRSRREVAQSLALILPGLVLGVRETAAKKPKKPARCGRRACAAEWPQDKDNRDACEKKCGRCRIRKKFCIVEGDPRNPARVATCCFEHQTCCPLSSGASFCADTRNDRNHCGTCGHACAEGELCVHGLCACGVPGGCDCPSGLQRCSAECVDAQTNRNHCGICGNACADWEQCQGGECRGCIGASCCQAGGDFPDYCVAPNGIGNCRNTQRDWANCGACNNRCRDWEQCVSGRCV